MVVDFHTHVLPGIDDGSASIEESMSMLNAQAQHGVNTIVATPHFYPESDSPERFLQRRNESYARLAEAIAEEPGLPEIILGAEVAYFRGISNCEALSELQIGNTGYVLIEMPGGKWPSYIYRELEELRYKQGLTPIIAHMDRYLGRFSSYGIPETLSQLPVLVQANANFFLYPSTRNRALRMLKKGQIQLLGSDCHNLTDRVVNIGPAVAMIRKKLGEQALEYIHANERTVLEKNK